MTSTEPCTKLTRRNPMTNLDGRTVASFGDEWSRYDQAQMSQEETARTFQDYFAVFPWSELATNAEGFDMGCGSGRWAKLAAPRVGLLNCIDPSKALDVARTTLAGQPNVRFYEASVDSAPLSASSQDFGYSLGVLHHVPDTAAAVRSCARLLKPGAPLLLYLYYAFDGRPLWFRLIWRASDLVRRVICNLPHALRSAVTDGIAVFVYWPLARLAGLVSRCGGHVSNVPLSYYKDHSLFMMRTDARDRFGTPLEQRFTRVQIETMMQDAGLTDIRFSDAAPFWCAVGRKSAT